MLIVQKFGGTSVGDLQRIQNVADRVSKTVKEGNDVVVVVSAMSGETNKLIEYANYFSENPAREATDLLLSSGERVTAALLSIALNEMGHPAAALSGRKAGIVTDNIHTEARIIDIDPSYMQNEINVGTIIVLTCIKGVYQKGACRPLGR